MKAKLCGQGNRVAQFLLALSYVLLLSHLVTYAPCLAQDSTATYSQDAFEEALIAANQATGRSDRVKYLKQALAIRPNHPDNIVLEYRIGVALSQHCDPTSNTLPNPIEAIPWFERILKEYQHETYYEHIPPSGTWDKQLLISKAAVQLVNARIAVGRTNAQVDRETLLRALDALNYSYVTRKQYWATLPKPRSLQELEDDPRNILLIKGRDAMGKHAARVARWEQAQKAVEKDEILNDLEMLLVRSAVSHYGYTFGPQKPWEVESAMRALIDRYPNTQIAEVAQSHIDQAAQMTRELADEILAQGMETVLSEQFPADSPSTELVSGSARGEPVVPTTTRSNSTGETSNRSGVLYWWVIGAAAAVALVIAAVVWARLRRTKRDLRAIGP